MLCCHPNYSTYSLHLLLSPLTCRVWYTQIDQDLWNDKKEYYQAKQHKTKIPLESPFMLLRFIRNCYTHATEAPVDFMIRESPYFLKVFPKLVIHLWEVCMKSPILREKFTLKPLLLPLYSPSLTVGSIGSEWM